MDTTQHRWPTQSMKHPRRVFGASLLLVLVNFVTINASHAGAFDHDHLLWTKLLKKHVVLERNGQASHLNYAGMLKDNAALQSYQRQLSQVTEKEFNSFTAKQQMAFLINAYNTYTVGLILTRYPKLSSIKDLGGLLSSPWGKSFITILGQKVSLDHIEHKWLRQRGRFDDPRIHFAVNCASTGCPMLREEAYQASMLDQQLNQQVIRFLSDRSRNRYNEKTKQLEVSKIFDWYQEDFESGLKGITSLPAFFSKYADQLAQSNAGIEHIRTQRASIAFMEYDWGLNDVQR